MKFQGPRIQRVVDYSLLAILSHIILIQLKTKANLKSRQLVVYCRVIWSGGKVYSQTRIKT